MSKPNIFSLSSVLSLLFAGLMLMSCEEEAPLKKFNEKEGVFILNEGNYTYGNSSLSFYNPSSQEVTNQVFRNTNGFPVGDVLQSLTIWDSTAFLVVNNSGKILAMNVNTFRHKGTIAGLVSPRQMLVLSPTKAYVSDLYSQSLAIVNPSTYTVTGSVNLKKGSESMLRYGDYVFVANWSKHNTVQRIEIAADKLKDSIVVTRQPNSMVLDKNEKLWVLSDGGLASLPGGKSRACLTRINPVTFTIEKEFFFPDLNSAPTRLSINKSRDTLFYLNGAWGSSVSDGGVYKMAVDASGLPGTAFIPENGKLFYGMGVDPENSDIYVSDAVDYLQPGWVMRYNRQGILVHTFRADIIPSSFCFKYD